jgi:Uma2 family endonuclease
MVPTRGGSAETTHPEATVADLLESLGDIPAERVLLHPTLGSATEADWEKLPNEWRKTCELIDGTLVRKPLGCPESILTCSLIRWIGTFTDPLRAAVIMGPDGPIRFLPCQLRLPDISVFLRSGLPNGKAPQTQVSDSIPDFVVEVISRGNSQREIERKVDLYLSRGVRLIWLVDPDTRTAKVVRPGSQPESISEYGVLIGDPVLTGLTVSLEDLFRELD